MNTSLAALKCATDGLQHQCPSATAKKLIDAGHLSKRYLTGYVLVSLVELCADSVDATDTFVHVWPTPLFAHRYFWIAFVVRRLTPVEHQQIAVGKMTIEPREPHGKHLSTDVTYAAYVLRNNVLCEH